MIRNSNTIRDIQLTNSIDKIQERERVKEAKVALGAILGFYRRIRKLSQEKVSGDAGLTKSSVAMFEAGKRLPSVEALLKLSLALKLNTFQRQQLEILAEYPRHPRPAGHEWFLPDDVLTGIPVFLRDLKKESDFQSKADIREMWIITGKPLALDGEMYKMLSERLAFRKTIFVYFIDSSAGEAPFRALWSKLRAEKRHRNRDITTGLKCVLTPVSLCLYHFGICNPSEDFGAMFGRSIIYAGGTPVGFVGMDPQQVTRAYRLLKPIYQQCLNNPGKEVKTDYGKFSLIDPR
jgi:transcriptional regulator with XRE-family HTH domain